MCSQACLFSLLQLSQADTATKLNKELAWNKKFFSLLIAWFCDGGFFEKIIPGF